jgi:hypothetical protein
MAHRVIIHVSVRKNEINMTYILQLIISLLGGPAGCGWALYEMDDNGAKADVSLFLFPFFFNSLCAKVLLRSLLHVAKHIWGMKFPTIKPNTRVSSTVLITFIIIIINATNYIFGEIRF